MKRLQFGRSMIEMLGVLAIVGVLSIGGVSMYRKAILNYRLGQTQHWFENVRFIFAEACANGNKIGCFATYPINGISEDVAFKQRADYVCSQGGTAICPAGWSTAYGSARTPLKENVLLLHMATDTESLSIYLMGLRKRICEAVIDYDWHGLKSISSSSDWTKETVQSGQKHLSQEQKDNLKAKCPFPKYMVLNFDLKS